MNLILDIQHTGRKSKPGDMGAAYDLDGDGVTGENGEREVDLVRGYTAAARDYALSLGWRVDVLDAGEYSERHHLAGQISKGGGRTAYLACHVNAGRGSYGLVRPDYRSVGGFRLAEALAASLGTLTPEITRARIELLYPSKTAASAGLRDVSTADQVAWWTRGWGCIDGIYEGPAELCGCLVEPFFIDWPGHKSLTTPEGLIRLGRTLVEGVRRWGAW